MTETWTDDELDEAIIAIDERRRKLVKRLEGGLTNSDNRTQVLAKAETLRALSDRLKTFQNERLT